MEGVGFFTENHRGVLAGEEGGGAGAGRVSAAN